MSVQIYEKGDVLSGPSFVEWLIVHAVSKHAGVRELDQVPGWEHIASCKDIEVTFQINGVDLPFKETLEDVWDQVDRMVAEKAAELVRDKFGDILSNLSTIQEDMVRAFVLLAEDKLGVKISLEDES